MKITIDRAVVEQALEALLNCPSDISDEMFESIRSLKAALAEPQEPDPWGAGYEAGYAAGVAEYDPQQAQQALEEADRIMGHEAAEAEPVQDTGCHAQDICQRSGYSIK